MQLSPNGLFRILEIAPTTANVSGSKVNVGAAVGSSVAAFLVIAALAAYGGRRWYLTRRKYKQLKNVHTEVMRRVTLLENGPAGDHVRKAALSQLITRWASAPVLPLCRSAAQCLRPVRSVPEDWEEYKPAEAAGADTAAQMNDKAAEPVEIKVWLAIAAHRSVSAFCRAGRGHVGLSRRHLFTPPSSSATVPSSLSASIQGCFVCRLCVFVCFVFVFASPFARCRSCSRISHCTWLRVAGSSPVDVPETSFVFATRPGSDARWQNLQTRFSLSFRTLTRPSHNVQRQCMRIDRLIA